MPELAAHLERVAKELLNELGLSVDGQPFFPEDVQAVAAALAACAREARREIAEQVRTLKHMAETCDQEGLAETPQKEWTPYQGKILAYDCVLAILEKQ